MATILVTGATGTVGADVAQVLAERYPEHRLLKASSKPREGEGWVVFDFLDPATFEPYLGEVDRIFFMRPPAMASVEKQFTPFLDALSAAGRLESVVFLSVQGAEGMPWVPHRKIEQALEARGLPWTFLRPSFFYQNLTGTHGQEIRETGALTLPAGNGRTSFVDTRDIAEVAAGILADPLPHQKKGYELTGSESLTYFEVMEELSLATGRPLVYRPVSFLKFYRHCRGRGISRSMTLIMSVLYGASRTGKAGHLSVFMGDFLGRAPRTLKQFAADYAHVWK